MGVTLQISNAPDDVVERMRARAQRNARSLESELMSILAAAAEDDDAEIPFMTPLELVAHLASRGYSSPDDSVAMIREDRDRANGRR